MYSLDVPSTFTLDLFSRMYIALNFQPILLCFVSALPEEEPKITGGKPRYQVGDTVRVNCTSGRSKPAAQLSWFINGEHADPNFLRGPDTIVTGREGLETSILGLEFAVRPKHFKKGDMKLKCLATIATLYFRSNEESVEGERPQRASVLESRGTVAPPGSRADRVQGVCHFYFQQNLFFKPTLKSYKRNRYIFIKQLKLNRKLPKVHSES